MNASRQIGHGNMTVLSSEAPASCSNSCVYCGGTSSLRQLPSSGTNAFRKTRRRIRSGTCSATFAMTVPPKLWPTSTTSVRAGATIASTIERTQSSWVTAVSAPLPWPAIVGVSTAWPSSRRRSATGPHSDPSCHEPWTRTKWCSGMGGSFALGGGRGQRRAGDDQLLDLGRALVEGGGAALGVRAPAAAAGRPPPPAKQLRGVADAARPRPRRGDLPPPPPAGAAPADRVVRPRGAVDE